MTHPRDWTRISTGSTWERDFAYSRALRAGPHVFLTGTVARPPENPPNHISHADAFAPDGPLRTAHAQTIRCYEIIESALFELGLDRTAITRSRIFVTDITLAPEVGRAHAEFFKDHRPCLTQVGVSALIAPEYLVEIECDAVAPDAP
jgi:isochorismate pyruvate lyase